MCCWRVGHRLNTQFVLAGGHMLNSLCWRVGHMLNTMFMLVSRSYAEHSFCWLVVHMLNTQFVLACRLHAEHSLCWLVGHMLNTLLKDHLLGGDRQRWVDRLQQEYCHQQVGRHPSGSTGKHTFRSTGKHPFGGWPSILLKGRTSMQGKLC